jgi:hypothetical protein
LLAGTYQETGVHIAFDNLRVWAVEWGGQGSRDAVNNLLGRNIPEWRLECN